MNTNKNYFSQFAMGLPLLVVLATASTTFATPFQVMSEKSNVNFEAVGKPSLMKIKGRGGKIQGELSIDKSKLSGNFRVPLADFDTGISLRNEHMKEKYLEIQKYPMATLEVKDLLLPEQWMQSKDFNIDFSGTLQLKNQKKAIHGKLIISGFQRQAQLEFAFKLSDFDVGIPSYMGVTVADAVTVRGDVTIAEVVRP